MARYKVVANPKGGTCSQVVEADSEEDAIAKAQAAPNNWVTAKPRSVKDWTIRAFNKTG